MVKLFGHPARRQTWENINKNNTKNKRIKINERMNIASNDLPGGQTDTGNGVNTYKYLK